jgi:flagellar hook-associated protein 2
MVMAGTISFGGIGSGLDTEGIVSGLVQASSAPVQALKSKATATKSAISSLSDVASMLSKLKNAVTALKDPRDVAGYSVTSSDTGIVATANGLAQPGSFDVKVDQLAKAHRSYSKGFGSSTTALGQAGTIDFTVGGTTKQLTVEATDTLENVATKINALGLRVNASIFNDGTNKSLQIRGLDTGAANGVTMVETGTSFDLNAVLNQKQTASDSRVYIDDRLVTRSDNQIVGAIQGVTLALKKEDENKTITIDIAADPSALKTKLQAVVDSYNTVVKKLHEVGGYGSQKGSNSVLASDTTLRSITNRLSSAVLTPIKDAGFLNSVGSLGIKFANDGTLKLDELALGKALESDPASVTLVLAGNDTKNGVMDVLSDVVNVLAERGKGTIAVRQQSLEARAKSLDTQVTKENERLEKYADALRKQFTAMDGAVAASNNLMNYIGRF